MTKAIRAVDSALDLIANIIKIVLKKMFLIGFAAALALVCFTLMILNLTAALYR